jgi:hypothetical protein
MNIEIRAFNSDWTIREGSAVARQMWWHACDPSYVGGLE